MLKHPAEIGVILNQITGNPDKSLHALQILPVRSIDFLTVHSIHRQEGCPPQAVVFENINQIPGRLPIRYHNRLNSNCILPNST